jgi:type II secretory pathway pseudopilin PulG
MIVSIAIFSIVMTMAAGAYLKLISLDRRARQTNQVAGSLSFALDAMMRGIRTGSTYRCLNGSPDSDGNTTLGTCTQFCYEDSTLPAGSHYVTYYTSGATLMRAESSSCGASGGYSFTDPSITITNASFTVTGSGATDTRQPFVRFTLLGTLPTGPQGEKTAFGLEEMVTQRLIDL